jgi:hypothetical protein
MNKAESRAENTEAVDRLTAYCRKNGRVCPQPDKWNQLWLQLPGRKRKGAGWEPSLPLILGAWHYASNLEKMLRLDEHIKWAERHGALSETDTFIRSLSEDQWHHLGD